VGRSSIADVIDNGAELAELLRPLARLTPEHTAARLKSVIDPVIEPNEFGKMVKLRGGLFFALECEPRHTHGGDHATIN
jgi:hypothetical protein